MPKETIEQILKRHTREIMSLSGVVGTGQGLEDGSPCITVFVTRLTPELRKKIPQQLDGYPVSIKESGMFRSFSQ